MKRLIEMNERQARLLNDQLNVQIIRKLVFNDLSVSELARAAKISVVKTWRRIQALRKEGLVELTETKRVANLEKKMFRATALRYITKEPFELKSNNKSLNLGQQIFAEIRSEIIRSVQEMNEIPGNLNPIDFGVAVDLYAMSKTYLKSEVQQKLRRILEEAKGSGLLSVE